MKSEFLFNYQFEKDENTPKMFLYGVIQRKNHKLRINLSELAAKDTQKATKQ